MKTKQTLQKLAEIAAAGMAVYAAHCFLWLFPELREMIHRLLPTETVLDDAYFGLWFVLLTAVSILTVVILLKQGKGEREAPREKYRILTYTVTLLLVAGIVSGCCHTCFTFYTTPTLYIPPVIRMPLLVSAAVWLWLLSRQPGTGKISKALRIASIAGIVCLCIPLLTMLVSVVYWCFNGYPFYYGSWARSSWTQTTVPAFLLVWYSIELFHNNRQGK